MNPFKRTGQIVLLLLMSGCFLKYFSPSFSGLAVNAQETNSPRDRYEGIAHIQSDSPCIETDKPYQLSITIDNISESHFSLRSYPILKLRKDIPETINVPGEDFYSTVYLEPGSEFRKKESLAQGDKVFFEVDITKLKWGRGRSAFRPSETIFEAVPKGNYILHLELPVEVIEADKKVPQTLSSNQIKVSIK